MAHALSGMGFIGIKIQWQRAAPIQERCWIDGNGLYSPAILFSVDNFFFGIKQEAQEEVNAEERWYSIRQL